MESDIWERLNELNKETNKLNLEIYEYKLSIRLIDATNEELTAYLKAGMKEYYRRHKDGRE